MSFELLSEPIRKYIREKRWTQLRPIQNAAIEKILGTDDHYILASKTASGKTEAAFLPILSKVNFNELGIQVLYISPLIALINDQFIRIEELCKNLGVPVTKWHGEANKTLKKKLVIEPSGVVLITPESLEAMFTNKPFYVKQLFSNLKYVVIDEIHAFIGTDRGTQVKSILSRLQKINTNPFRLIGLSATIGDYQMAKKFTGDELKTKVLLDRTIKETIIEFRFFLNFNDSLPQNLIDDLYQETKENKVLIFPNSRGKTEDVAVGLKRMAEREKGHLNYFTHHSSIDRDTRECIEYFAKNNNHQSFCIACTSTLELGIDIGVVDKVIQIDATYNIASMIQRIGRSGRNEGSPSHLILYATNQWSLLQSISCWALYKEGFIEPPMANEQPYDILCHQILSIVKEHSGIPISVLITKVSENFAFNKIEKVDIEAILDQLIQLEYLEKIRDEVIIGLEAERIVNHRDFFCVFQNELGFRVYHLDKKIGEIPNTPQVKPEEKIFLSAKMWEITFVDYKTKKVEVKPASDGKATIFPGSGVVVHQKIREKMFAVLNQDTKFDFLDQNCMDALEYLRKDQGFVRQTLLQNDRPIFEKEKHLVLCTFTGTKINRTLHLLLNALEIKNSFNDYSSQFFISELTTDAFLLQWQKLTNLIENVSMHIETQFIAKPSLLHFSKWGSYLPLYLQVRLLKENYYDIQSTLQFLSSVRLVSIHK